MKNWRQFVSSTFGSMGWRENANTVIRPSSFAGESRSQPPNKTTKKTTGWLRGREWLSSKRSWFFTSGAMVCDIILRVKLLLKKVTADINQYLSSLPPQSLRRHTLFSWVQINTKVSNVRHIWCSSKSWLIQDEWTIKSCGKVRLKNGTCL